MKRTTLALVVVGIVLEIAAFLVSNADEIPFVLHVVSPDYARAMEGLARLESGGLAASQLLPGMPGFEECADLYIQMFRQQASQEELADLRINRFHHLPRVSLDLSPGEGSRTVRHLEVHLSNGQQVSSSLESLEAKIERLKRGDLFSVSAFVFCLGVLLQVLAIVAEERR